MIRVVLVDDHPMFREGLRFTLERAGDIKVVGEADDGRAALELVAATDPDVVVMDLAMPRLDGLAATEQLVAAGARAGILVLTFSEEDAAVFAAVRAGARGYLVKGVAAEQVVSGVRAVAAGHAVFGPGLATRMLEFFGGGRPREPRFPDLSEREHEVLAHLGKGWTNQQIADAFVISPITVRNHVSSILMKLRVANRREAMLRYHDK
jgi:DNA-binding NarL/FixJ family response regulator